MSYAGALFILLPFFVGLLLAFAAVGLGVFFLVRYFRRRGAKVRMRRRGWQAFSSPRCECENFFIFVRRMLY